MAILGNIEKKFSGKIKTLALAEKENDRILSRSNNTN